MFTARLFSLFVLAGVASAKVNARQDGGFLVGRIESNTVFGFIGSFPDVQSPSTHNFTASYKPGISVDEDWVVSKAFTSVKSFEGEWTFEGTIGPAVVDIEVVGKGCEEGDGCYLIGSLEESIGRSYEVSGNGKWN